jgi:short chain dehydrogenase
MTAMTEHRPIIVVTGGNRGIGFEICRQLASRGAQVVLTARKPDAGQEAVKQLGAQNQSVQFHPLDTTRAESIAALCEFLEQSFGHLDALVNNAGIITKEEASGLEVKLVAVRETLETNTLAPLHLSQALVPLLKRSKAGRIVNISSGMGQLSDLSHFENRVERCYRHSGSRITRRGGGQRGLPWLGQDRHGWQECRARGFAGRGRCCVACARCAAGFHGEFYARWKSNSLVRRTQRIL